jgi:predicted PilT family ATPase
VEISDLLQALQEVENRAERVSDQHLLDTYVNAGALVGALSSRDNGIVYGRRGTGKTHALKYLAETEKRKGNFVVYIDMEQDLGSTEGLYSDPSLLVAERATRLLVDVLGIIHNKLIEDAFSDEAAGGRIEVLDEMCEHFGEIVVVNQIEQEQTTASERGAESSMKVKLNLKTPSVDLDDKTTDKSAQQVRETRLGRSDTGSTSAR